MHMDLLGLRGIPNGIDAERYQAIPNGIVRRRMQAEGTCDFEAFGGESEKKDRTDRADANEARGTNRRGPLSSKTYLREGLCPHPLPSDRGSYESVEASF